MNNMLAVVLVGLLVLAIAGFMGSQSSNLCVEADNNNFPFGATKQTIRNKYGGPKSKYMQTNTTRWIYTYHTAMSVGKCKIGIVFQDNKAVDYKMKEEGEPGFELLFE